MIPLIFLTQYLVNVSNRSSNSILTCGSAAAPRSMFDSGKCFSGIESTQKKRPNYPLPNIFTASFRSERQTGPRTAIFNSYSSNGGHPLAADVRPLPSTRGNISNRVYPEFLNYTVIQHFGGPATAPGSTELRSVLTLCFCSRSESFNSRH